MVELTRGAVLKAGVAGAVATVLALGVLGVPAQSMPTADESPAARWSVLVDGGHVSHADVAPTCTT